MNLSLEPSNEHQAIRMNSKRFKKLKSGFRHSLFD